jgi:DNA-binding response OmpR family regulator
MRIAMLMRDDALFAAIRNVFDEDGAFTSHRFGDEASLIRFVERQEVGLVVLDTDRECAPQNAFLAWRNCHCVDALPVIVTGRFRGKACMTAAFDAGADDIVVGQLSPIELLVRVKQVLKRREFKYQPVNCIEFAPFTLDRSATTLLRNDRAIPLTSREFAIAWLFFSNPGNLLTRSQIAYAIWGKSPEIVGRTLEQHIYKLRCKLQLHDSASSLQLSTVYSRGYKLKSAPAKACQPVNQLLRAA